MKAETLRHVGHVKGERHAGYREMMANALLPKGVELVKTERIIAPVGSSRVAINTAIQPE